MDALSPWITAAALLALVVLAAGYVTVGLYPAAVAQRVVSSARSVRDPTSMWDLVESLRARRAIVRRGLIGCILALGGACAALLAVARERLHPGVSDAWLVVVVIVFMGAVGALAWLRESGLGSPRLREVQEPSALKTARRAIGGVAIAAGMPAPQTRVVAHTSPTAFTVLERGTPTVYFTAGLLALLSTDELEAVAAHEIGHLASNAIAESDTVESMLDLLRILGAAALVLFLLVAGSEAIATAGLIVAAVLAIALAGQTTPEWDPGLAAYADAMLVLASPGMVLANLFAHLIGFVLGREEDLLADLRAVELTRHPEALHAALRKLRDVTPASSPLPMAYQFKYFTAEGIVPESLTPVQPPIEARLEVLERIDPSLRAAAPIRRRGVTCPDCRTALSEATIASHYDAPIPVDRCPVCGGVWFDALELYMAATPALVAEATWRTAEPPRASLECPRCRLPLRRSAPYGAAAGVWLYECSVCGGAWVRSPDLVKFGQQRERARRPATRTALDPE
ncbi:MAG TPA: zinc metalloprotease HtpX [bacterium]|nr:zinc metalloprotease HtpX [bacterium]